jgi:antitoxin (DNA-binding transcriptional repressor) of toxin-antitoxin stability system
MSYKIHQAKTHLSRLVKEAEAGKEVILMRGKKPVARITAVEQKAKPDVPFRLLGAYPQISWTPDAFDPLSDKELIEMGFDYLVDVPLFPGQGKSAEEE